MMETYLIAFIVGGAFWAAVAWIIIEVWKQGGNRVSNKASATNQAASVGLGCLGAVIGLFGSLIVLVVLYIGAIGAGLISENAARALEKYLYLGALAGGIISFILVYQFALGKLTKGRHERE